MDKKRIAVIFGGCSTEYEVSLQSAHAVITHLDKELFDVVMIGITRDGRWLHYNGNLDKLLNNTWFYDASCVKAILSPDRRDKGLLEIAEDSISLIKLDAVFPVLHGKNGEDGTLQGLIELSGIPLVGCGTLSSALCMDKDLAHKIVYMAGIKTPSSVIIRKDMEKNLICRLTNVLTFPVFVKPVKSGSSFGITKVLREDDLWEAVEAAFIHDDKVIIEENIEGFEVGCAILGNEQLIVGEVDEIELTQGFFDFTEKYTLKSSTIHMPARINHELAHQVKETAKTIYQELGCKGFARVDMFLTPNGDLVFNEVNTIPGFTSHSRYPNMLKGIGFDYSRILKELIYLAIKD
ncbi:D-alanine--D-alanine ligase [Anaerocolumna cellulosilytica]|uniref:D-alanine--D-alanine ligase n=1 Tax=Anaerocolumna cellulosilytica TaxID=433286 RepID=A0A6S6R6C6_9FIRM|nr:D-alanine--D-serine ligase VanG [Anaerocolumna cellulosilytica]MBB5193771.1 D-alanine---D-serine ligase [Anaerocolumna cellulosilytica]BCJ95012.1 D-alanine--D-alanine ligase [Anaerocolumna cellulosilytica]